MITANEALRILRRARRLVARGWCQGAHAVDLHGRPCDPISPRAARYSAHGAVTRAKHELDADYLATQVARLRLDPTGYLGFFNDDPATTKEDVLKRFERTIMAVEQGLNL